MMPGPTYHCEVTDSAFRMWFLAPRQLLLMEEWEALVSDETLRQADARGVILLGSVMVRAEEAPQQTQLTEGIPLGAIMMGVDLVKITAEAVVGARL